MAHHTSPAGSPAGPTAQEALMTTQTHPITPAVRFDVERQRRDLAAGTLHERAIRKAQHIESRPANYTEPMLRWAEFTLSTTYGNAYAELQELAEIADEAGWLA